MTILHARKSSFSSGLKGRVRGFTLLELIAVVAIIAVLVTLLSAALNHTKEKAFRISCINNLKQLQSAWMLYVNENDSYFPLNQSAPAPVNHPRIPVSLKTSSNSWVSSSSPLMDLTTANIKRGSLYEYVGSANSYRCPLDSSTVHNHPDTPRTRSYAMSAYLGGDEGSPRVKYKESELLNPRPVNTFVFIEEHESSLWAANFMVVPPERLSMASSLNWVSTPSDRHYQGCNLSFADGHIEYWRWLTPKQRSDYRLASSGRELRDIRRLQACVPED